MLKLRNHLAFPAVITNWRTICLSSSSPFPFAYLSMTGARVSNGSAGQWIRDALLVPDLVSGFFTSEKTSFVFAFIFSFAFFFSSFFFPLYVGALRFSSQLSVFPKSFSYGYVFIAWHLLDPQLSFMTLIACVVASKQETFEPVTISGLSEGASPKSCIKKKNKS